MLEDARAIRSVYGDEVPELDRARPVNLTFSSPGGVSQVRCGLALAIFPKSPPKKYFGDDTIYIEITLDGVDKVVMSGCPSETRAQVELSRKEKGVDFSVGSTSMSLSVSAEVATLSKITSYTYEINGSRI